MQSNVLTTPNADDSQIIKYLVDSLQQRGVKYNPVEDRTEQLDNSAIIAAISGGDRTKGSCASAGLAYIGQQLGYDIRDFRGGESQDFFSNGLNLYQLSISDGMKSIHADGASSVTVGNRLLQKVEDGKEYYLVIGKHAAMVRKSESGELQYLELQSPNRSGWTNFGKEIRSVLRTRFGCSTSSDSGYSANFDFMIDVAESNFKTNAFRSLLGFLNTAVGDEKKGKYGTIR